MSDALLRVGIDIAMRADEGVRVRRYVAEGFWTDETLGSILAEGFRAAPDERVGFRSEVRPWRGTYADAFAAACRVAGGLRARGVGPGDLVAIQLPNWPEAASTFWAVALLGAVPVPIVHFYGPKEVGFILRECGARVLVTGDRFGPFDFLATLEQVRTDAPALEEAFVVGDDVPSGARPFSVLDAADPIDGPVATDPMAPALVAYTSGTTAEPKGVVHSHRTIGFEIKQLSGLGASGRRPQLVGAPVGHAIGMLGALLLPVYRRDPVHLIDVWDPGRVLVGMREDDLGAGSGSTYFLTSLLDHPDFGPDDAARMQRVGLGGSPVPAAVGERAERLGISIVRSYGSTEHPSVTGGHHDDPRDQRLAADGRPMLGVEIELRDDDGRPVGPGEPGEIWSRGPDCFVGYTDPELTRAAFDDAGWFATGDVGVVDEDGFLRIVDRKKDVIIRGGENISAAEVEELLVRMPAVAEAAVVAAPDERLGEHACAFVRTQPGAAPPDLDAVRAHLDAAGLAKQKWPEELRPIEDFPRTPSGKIKKFVLREELRHPGA